MPGPPDDAPFLVASHEVLFADDEELLCDACGALVPRADDVGGFDLPGSGVYMWIPPSG
jgi:hypothetical protein